MAESKMTQAEATLQVGKLQSEATLALAKAIAELSQRMHLDKMVTDKEAWHCPVCDRYFTYFQQIPVAVDIVIGQQHFVCHECYAKLNAESDKTND